MDFKRSSNNTYSGTTSKDNKVAIGKTKSNAKKHMVNIILIIIVLFIALIVKGWLASSDNTTIKNTFDSPDLVELDLGIYKSSYSVDRDSSPELLAEVAELRKEIDDIKEVNVALASRGEVVRQEGEIIYNYNKLEGAPKILGLIEEECKKHANNDTTKEFFETIYSIITYESHFNPLVVTKTSTEHSIGLLQVNTNTNKPKNVDIEQFRKKLKNPQFNLDYQLNELYDFYILGKSKGLKGKDLACFVSKYGQRPNWKDKKTREYIIKTISKAYTVVQKARINS